jgi:hypothetical protein
MAHDNDTRGKDMRGTGREDYQSKDQRGQMNEEQGLSSEEDQQAIESRRKDQSESEDR